MTLSDYLDTLTTINNAGSPVPLWYALRGDDFVNGAGGARRSAPEDQPYVRIQELAERPAVRMHARTTIVERVVMAHVYHKPTSSERTPNDRAAFLLLGALMLAPELVDEAARDLRQLDLRFDGSEKPQPDTESRGLYGFCRFLQRLVYPYPVP